MSREDKLAERAAPVNLPLSGIEISGDLAQLSAEGWQLEPVDVVRLLNKIESAGKPRMPIAGTPIEKADANTEHGSE